MTKPALARRNRVLLAASLLVLAVIVGASPSVKGKGKPGGDPPPPPPPPAPFNYVLEILPNVGDNVSLLSLNDYGDVVGDVAPSRAGTFVYLRRHRNLSVGGRSARHGGSDRRLVLPAGLGHQRQ